MSGMNYGPFASFSWNVSWSKSTVTACLECVMVKINIFSIQECVVVKIVSFSMSGMHYG
jgi:hypothetical protein